MSIYGEGVLPAIWQRIRHHISTNPKLEYSEVVNFAQRWSEGQGGMPRLNTQSVPMPYRTPTISQQEMDVLATDTATDAESFHTAHMRLDVELQAVNLEKGE